LEINKLVLIGLINYIPINNLKQVAKYCIWNGVCLSDPEFEENIS
jgi:hypothetical protein